MSQKQMLVSNKPKIQDTFIRNRNYIVHISSSVLTRSIFPHFLLLDINSVISLLYLTWE